MNNTTLAHIGGDLLLIGGVAFYCHKRTSTLATEIEELRKENAQMHDAIDDLQRTIQQLGGIVMQSRRAAAVPSAPAQSTASHSHGTSKKSVKRTHQTRARVVVDNESDTDSDAPLDAQELNAVVDAELAALNKSGACTGDTCALPLNK